MEKDEENTNEHQLWISLSSLGDGNVFAYLPKLMEKLIADKLVEDGLEDNYDLVFPSDETWRTKIYLKMLAKQRLVER